MMKFDSRHASQIVEYLLLFVAVVSVVIGVSQFVGQKTGTVLDDALDGLGESIYTYSWVPGNCSSCSASCGGGTMSCSYVCTRSDDRAVDPAYCSATAQPGATTLDCNTQPCPIDCVWGDWVIGDCTPVCGEDRIRIDTRSVATQAEYGGVACTGDAARTIRDDSVCPDLACTGICGEGLVSLNEECDGTNFGNFGSGVCHDPSVEAKAGRKFVAGDISCYPPGHVNECQIDMSQCIYEECTAWVSGTPPGACGASASCTPDADDPDCLSSGVCKEGALLYTRDCSFFRVDGTSLGTVTVDRCMAHPACSNECAPRDVNSWECLKDAPPRDSYPWTYTTGESCPEDPGPCTAICRPADGFEANAAGSGCDCLGNWTWDDDLNLCGCKANYEEIIATQPGDGQDDTGYTLNYTSPDYGQDVTFKVDVWSEDLNYCIKFFDASGTEIARYEWPRSRLSGLVAGACGGRTGGHDKSDDIDHSGVITKKAYKVELMVQEGGSGGGFPIGYSVSCIP